MRTCKAQSPCPRHLSMEHGFTPGSGRLRTSWLGAKNGTDVESKSMCPGQAPRPHPATLAHAARMPALNPNARPRRPGTNSREAKGANHQQRRAMVSWVGQPSRAVYWARGRAPSVWMGPSSATSLESGAKQEPHALQVRHSCPVRNREPCIAGAGSFVFVSKEVSLFLIFSPFETEQRVSAPFLPCKLQILQANWEGES